MRCFQNAPRCRFFLDVRRKGREFREGGTGEGVKEEQAEIEKRRKSTGEREGKRARAQQKECVCPAGGETVSHFLCFGGSGLISPSVTSVSLAAVTECDTKVF